jgi:hypothetical protein
MGILSGSIFITWKQRTNTKKNSLLEGNTKYITNFKTRGKIRKLIMYFLTYYFFYYLFLIMVLNALIRETLLSDWNYTLWEYLFLYSNLAIFLHITYSTMEHHQKMYIIHAFIWRPLNRPFIYFPFVIWELFFLHLCTRVKGNVINRNR